MKGSTKVEMIIRELRRLPASLLDEVLDFVQFVHLKAVENETAIASESSLGKDWLRPEEDEAWRDL